MWDFFITPFITFPFMQRALLASLMVAISSGIVGSFLVMRRMSLVGDALSHGILPGIALGFMFYGFNLVAMGIGGVIAGALIALLAFVVSRFTKLNEDASFAAFYLISLAIGVVIISKIGSQVDLLHILFGSVLTIDNAMLVFLWAIMCITLLAVAIIYRPLVLFIIDPIFLQSMKIRGISYYAIFLFIVVINLIAGFQALGSLMAVGLLMLPVIIGQLWVRSIEGLFIVIVILGFLIAYFGLLSSFYLDVPSGPAIIGVAGILYFFSLLFGRSGGILTRVFRLKHKTA
ncbi:metal ABC transporter permease [Wohlfahrtiimonas sp. G9077]|uniref:metal ABC transporter permease n=1 Tax=Wohlfahrtiimonas sp. G9077 TaxID=1980118 RepID=UPI000B983821|nr:metal ABC transporter permease [Wohlfahrtiimonas sp. G9077]OYQ72808.1 zinc ABC transporter permease [Wohlfahrtiimonas sp. G9077]